MGKGTDTEGRGAEMKGDRKVKYGIGWTEKHTEARF